MGSCNSKVQRWFCRMEESDDELMELDRNTRKMMTMHGVLHPKSDVDRLYLQKQKGGRGLISCEEMCVKAFTKLDAPYNDLQTGDKIKIPV